jgi:hypothetical protein
VQRLIAGSSCQYLQWDTQQEDYNMLAATRHRRLQPSSSKQVHVGVSARLEGPRLDAGSSSRAGTCRGGGWGGEGW